MKKKDGENRSYTSIYSSGGRIITVFICIALFLCMLFMVIKSMHLLSDIDKNIRQVMDNESVVHEISENNPGESGSVIQETDKESLHRRDDVTKTTDSDYIAIGITIITIAISIWAGLNIIHSLDENHVERVAARAIENSKKATEDFNGLYTRANEIIEDERTRKISEMQHLLYTTGEVVILKWIDELLFGDRDFGKNSEFERRMDKYLTRLIEIEQLFRTVIRSNIPTGSNKTVITERANIAIKKINDIIDEKPDERTEKYLKYRKAEFIFYTCGYKSGAEKYNACSEASDLYLFVFEDLFGNSPFPKKNMELAQYVANTVGQISNNILAYEEKLKSMNFKDDVLLKYKNDAKKYCKMAVDIYEENKEKGDNYENEVYFRNYGAVLENIDKINNNHANKDEILKNYEAAFKSAARGYISFPEERWKSVYFVYISYLYRMLLEDLKINNCPNGTLPSFADLKKVCESRSDDINKLFSLASMARRRYPNENRFHFAYGIASGCVVLQKSNGYGATTEDLIFEMSKANQELVLLGCDNTNKEYNRFKWFYDEIIDAHNKELI